MKNLKTISFLALSCLLALTISATGTVKQMATQLLAAAEEESSVYSGDGTVHTISPSSIGWNGDNIAATDAWELHMTVDASAADEAMTGFNSNGSTLLASNANAGDSNPGNGVFKLYLTHPSLATSGVLKYVDYLNGTVNNSNSFTKTRSKLIDVTVIYDGNGHLTCTPTIDGEAQTPYSCDVTLSAITSFSYALPAGINITSIDIAPYSVPTTLTVAADENGSISSVQVAGQNAITSGSFNNITVPGGKAVTLTATPNAGYKFDGWYDGATEVSSANPYTFTPSTGSNKTITAKFSVGYTEPMAGSTASGADKPQNFNAAYVKTFTAQVGRGAATNIYNVESWPASSTSFFVLVPTAVNANPGDSVKLTWTGKDITNTRLSAFADLNADYTFTTDTLDYTYAIGTFENWTTNNSPDNSAVVNGNFTFKVPENMQPGTQFRVRLRFDCKWTNTKNSTSWEGKVNTYPNEGVASEGVVPANDYMYRPVYDIVINVQEEPLPMNGKYCRIRSVKARNVGNVWYANPIATAATSKETPHINAKAEVNLYDPANASYQPANMIWSFEPSGNGYKLRHANSQALTNDQSTTTLTNAAAAVALNADQTETGLYSFVAQNYQDGGKTPYMLKILKSDGSEAGRYVNKMNSGTLITYWTGGTSDGQNDFVFDEVTTVPVTFLADNSKYTTLCLPFAVSIPEDVTAYYVKLTENNTFDYVELTGGKIPAFTGVLLKAATAQSYDFPILYEDVPAIADNALVGVTCKTTAIAAGSILTLGRQTAGVGMYVTTAATAMEYNTAYLPKPAGYTGTGRAFDATDSEILLTWDDFAGSVKLTYSAGDVTEFPINVPFNTSVTITATPDAGYTFEKWVDANDVQVSTDATYTLNTGDGNINYKAVFKGIDHNGEFVIKCNAATDKHDWTLKYNSIGTTATIEGLEQPAGAGHCEGGCEVTIPSVLEGAYTIPGTQTQLDITLNQVGTTIAQDLEYIKKLTLPATVEEIRRSRVVDLTSSALPLLESDIPSGTTETHAGSGFAWKWEVSPVVTKSEEWWFVGEFDFPTTLGDAFKDWGCALLTSRKWPSQTSDNWTNRFQIWINGDRDGLSGVDRIAGDIRLVDDQKSAGSDLNFKYFKDAVGDTIINVLGKTVKFEVHNYPSANDSTTLIYTVKTYDTANYGPTSTSIEQGSITTTVSGFQNINWLSNYVPGEVSWRGLKFFRPESKMVTYYDGAAESEETAPITNGEMTLTKTLTNSETWITAVKYVPNEVGVSKTIIASNGNDGTAAVSDGFRITQNTDNSFSLFANNTEYTFTDVTAEVGNPLDFTLYHVGNQIKVSVADPLNMLNVDATGTAVITNAITSMKTDATLADNKFSVTVAGQEHLLFANCPNLQEVVLQNQNRYKTINGAIYDETGFTLIRWPEGKAISGSINSTPNNVSNRMLKASQTEEVEEEPEYKVDLSESTGKIASMAFFGVGKGNGNGNGNSVAVNLKNVKEVEDNASLNSNVTYVTTPANFSTIKKNGNVNFRLDLEQGVANMANVEGLDEKTFSQIGLSDRFATATTGNWYTFTVPFDMDNGEINSNFHEVRKLTDADVILKDGEVQLRVKFAKVNEIEAGVPYIVKAKKTEIRLKSRVFETEKNDIEPITATTELTDIGYTYKVAMNAILDPENVVGTDPATSYIHTYMLSNNSFVQVPAGKTAQNKGYRGWLTITATPKVSGQSGAPRFMLSLDESGEATGIIEIETDDDNKANAVYTLSGIYLGNSIDELPAGVYIINNKKVVKK